MSALSTGVSGLLAFQRLIDLTGQNIANANTPGYHRQVADLTARNFGQEIGAGVDIRQIRRPANGFLDEAVLRNGGETNSLTAQLDTLQQVQTYFFSQDGSTSDLLGKLFDQFEQLSAHPDDLAQRGSALQAAGNLTDNLNFLASKLSQLSDGLDAQSAQNVQQVNNLTAEIAHLNYSIFDLSNRGLSSNDLRDQRDQRLADLGSLVDVRTSEEGSGVVNVLAGGVPVVIGTQNTPVQFTVDANNRAKVVVANGSGGELSLTGGKLGGDLQARNQLLPGLRNQLNTFTKELVRRLDEAHATGLNLTGPATSIRGNRMVRDVTAPLDQAGLAFPIQAGSLFVSVTELATGTRTIHEVAIDPATQNLQDVASSISGVDHIQGVVDTQTKTLRLLAQPGYAIDFAGRLPTAPENVAIIGTASVKIGGNYSGTNNDRYTFQIAGDGSVGVTPNLALEVRDRFGTLLGSFNIGSGYEPGSSLSTVNGVAVHLSKGTVATGDQFEVPVTSQPDTAGILPGLGLNTFFSGTEATNISVRKELMDHPELLNASRTGQAGDGSNLEQFAALRDSPVLPGGQDFSQYLGALVTHVGSQVQNVSQQQTAKQAMDKQLQAQQQAVSGVDPNEELVQLLQFQRSFQLSARYLSVVNQTLDELASLIH